MQEHSDIFPTRMCGIILPCRLVQHMNYAVISLSCRNYVKKSALQLLHTEFFRPPLIENFFLFLIFRYPIPPCDFSVKGVTSISVDVHKYGLAPKGTSVVLYRNHEIRKVVSFCEAFRPYFDWIGIVGVFTYIQ